MTVFALALSTFRYRWTVFIGAVVGLAAELAVDMSSLSADEAATP